MDATGVTVNQRLSLLPVILSFCVIRKELRFKKKYTRILGYIPTQSGMKVNEMLITNSRTGTRGINCRNFHRMLKPIIDSLTHAQNELKTSPVWLRIGKARMKKTVHFFPAFFIGDAKQQDLLACRYATYQNAKRISRFCMTCFDDADKSDHLCVPITKSHVQCLVNSLPDDRYTGHSPGITGERYKSHADLQNRLKELNTHNCVNSLWELDDGGNPLLPLPHDTMHLFSGIFQKMMEVLFDNCSIKAKMFLDNCAEDMIHNVASSEKDCFPRIKMSKGLTHLSLMTSDEWSGLLLACIVIMKTRTFQNYTENNPF